MRRDSSETKRKILTVCVRLFLEQGYKNTSVSQIVDEADVARGSYLNLFPTKDRVLLDLTEMLLFAQNEKTFRIKYKKCVFVKMYNVAKKYPRRKSKSAWVFSFFIHFSVSICFYNKIFTCFFNLIWLIFEQF